MPWGLSLSLSLSLSLTHTSHQCSLTIHFSFIDYSPRFQFTVTITRLSLMASGMLSLHRSSSLSVHTESSCSDFLLLPWSKVTRTLDCYPQDRKYYTHIFIFTHITVISVELPCHPCHHILFAVAFSDGICGNVGD